VTTVGQATVCYCSGVAPTISKHLVCTLSNNHRLHQSTCKSSTLKGLFEKAKMSRYRKALCTTVLGLFSHLKF